MATVVKILRPWILAIFALLSMAACQRKCQPMATQSYQSLVETPWRLVQSTDPEVARNLNNYNFLVVSFNRNSTGEVKRVVDNDQYDTPVQTLVWVPNVSTKMIRVQYSSASGAAPGDDGTFDYTYTLGRQLEMTDTTNGYYYRYVPFQGVVDPDVSCSF